MSRHDLARRQGVRGRSQRPGRLDLRDREATIDAITSAKPDIIIDAAAKVGGIMANSTYPVEFLKDNLLIETNVMDAAHAADIDRLLFLGSSCIYPRHATQRIRESSLMTGPLEPTNQAYLMAKISGSYYIEAHRTEYGRHWISAMPTNLYGPKDNFDRQSSHVLPAFIRRFHEAKVAGAPTVTVWGTVAPRREFLHVDDLAQACLMLLEKYHSHETINAGLGDDRPIKELAETVAQVVGFAGEIEWDTSKPDGIPRKLLDTGRINEFGWYPTIKLRSRQPGRGSRRYAPLPTPMMCLQWNLLRRESQPPDHCGVKHTKTCRSERLARVMGESLSE